MPGPNKFTTKAMEALQAAQDLAYDKGTPIVEPLHLLITLLAQQDGVVSSVMKKIGIEPTAVAAEAQLMLTKGEPVGGGTANVQISPALDRAVRAANKIAD